MLSHASGHFLKCSFCPFQSCANFRILRQNCIGEVTSCAHGIAVTGQHGFCPELKCRRRGLIKKFLNRRQGFNARVVYYFKVHFLQSQARDIITGGPRLGVFSKCILIPIDGHLARPVALMKLDWKQYSA